MYKNDYFYNRAKLYISIHVYKTITFYRHPLQEINIDSERKRPWRRECFFASVVISFSGVQKIKVIYAISPTSPNVIKPGLRTFIISSRVSLI